MKVLKLRLTVFRKWNQIAVKDFEPQDANNLFKYANDTWNDVVRSRISVFRESKT